MHTNLESLPCTTQANVLYVNYASIKKIDMSVMPQLKEKERKKKGKEKKKRKEKAGPPSRWPQQNVAAGNHGFEWLCLLLLKNPLLLGAVTFLPFRNCNSLITKFPCKKGFDLSHSQHRININQ